MSGLYALLLLISIGGMTMLDRRYKFALFNRLDITLKILAVCILIFILWDVAGILTGIFFIGETDFLLGLKIGEFPIEELLFLFLLNYCSLLTYLAMKTKFNSK